MANIFDIFGILLSVSCILFAVECKSYWNRGDAKCSNDCKKEGFRGGACDGNTCGCFD